MIILFWNNEAAQFHFWQLAIHKWEPDIRIGFSPALHLHCVLYIYSGPLRKRTLSYEAPFIRKKELIWFRMESPLAYRKVSVHSVGQEASHVQRTGSCHSQRSFRQAPMGEGELQDNYIFIIKTKNQRTSFPQKWLW
jgi:hypothetical protein